MGPDNFQRAQHFRSSRRTMGHQHSTILICSFKIDFSGLFPKVIYEFLAWFSFTPTFIIRGYILETFTLAAADRSDAKCVHRWQSVTWIQTRCLKRLPLVLDSTRLTTSTNIIKTNFNYRTSCILFVFVTCKCLTFFVPSAYIYTYFVMSEFCVCQPYSFC